MRSITQKRKTGTNIYISLQKRIVAENRNKASFELTISQEELKLLQDQIAS